MLLFSLFKAGYFGADLRQPREGTETLPYKLRGFCGIFRVVGDADPYKGAIEYARGKSMDFADYGNNQRIDSTVCTAMRGL